MQPEGVLHQIYADVYGRRYVGTGARAITLCPEFVEPDKWEATGERVNEIHRDFAMARGSAQLQRDVEFMRNLHQRKARFTEWQRRRAEALQRASAEALRTATAVKQRNRR